MIGNICKHSNFFVITVKKSLRKQIFEKATERKSFQKQMKKQIKNKNYCERKLKFEIILVWLKLHMQQITWNFG